MGVFPTSDRIERHRAFLKREPSDRPLFGCNMGLLMHEVFPSLAKSIPAGQVTPDQIRVDLFLEECERLYQSFCELNDDYPFVGAAFIYVPWMEAIMGCPIRSSGTTMWAEPAVPDWETWHWEKPSLDRNPWALKLMELTKAVVEHSAGRYPVAPTLMRGPADMLSAMRGATRFALDFYDYPAAVRRAAELCTEVWLEVGKAQMALVPESSSGYIASGHGLRFWAPDKIIWLQEDAMALLSPRLFREFILPWDRRIASEFPYVAFHLHGSALWAVHDLVKVPELDVIELNFEAAPGGVEGIFTGWKQILEQKPLVAWGPYDPLPNSWLHRVWSEFPPRGLSVQATVSTLEEGQALTAKLLGPNRVASRL